jgi:hypothetical protein
LKNEKLKIFIHLSYDLWNIYVFGKRIETFSEI